MFLHNFKYSLKVLLKNKMLLFWTFIFPLVLGAFFKMAFSDIEKNEKLDIIDIAIVDDEDFQNNRAFVEAFKELGDKNSSKHMFNVKYVSKNKADFLLEKDEISGYLDFNADEVMVAVNSSGIDETILRYVVDEISSEKEMIERLIEINVNNSDVLVTNEIDYKKIYDEAVELVNSNTAKINNVSRKNLSYTMIEYYTLLAMSCLYGGILSMFVINSKLADMSDVGKRVTVSPISKLSMILGSLLASYIVQVFGVILLFLFTIFVLNVSYGDNLLYVLVLSFVGSFAGLSLGIGVATLVKANDNTKTGILIAIVMAGCFLSGMMGITMKYLVDTHVPFINKINPVAMITDGFYSLYYYDTKSRFLLDVTSLIVFSCFMLLLSVNGLRRQKYDSI